MAYIAPTDIADALEITTLTAKQTNIATIICAGVSRAVEKFTNRKWDATNNTTDIVEKYDGGQTKYFPKFTPIKSVSSVKIDGVVHNDFYIYDTYIDLDGRASVGKQNVEITYRTDATTCPEDVKAGLLLWAIQLFNARADGKVASQTGAGPVNSTFMVSEDIPKFLKLILESYIKFSF